MKGTGQDLIKKILYLVISQLNGIIFCFHLTEKTEKPYNTFLEKFNSLHDSYAPLKKILKVNQSLKISPG